MKYISSKKPRGNYDQNTLVQRVLGDTFDTLIYNNKDLRPAIAFRVLKMKLVEAYSDARLLDDNDKGFDIYR